MLFIAAVKSLQLQLMACVIATSAKERISIREDTTLLQMFIPVIKRSLTLTPPVKSIYRGETL